MAKFKLDLEDFSPNITNGFGIGSLSSAVDLCYQLNLEVPELQLKRLKEDLYTDYKGIRFYFRLFGYENDALEQEIRLVENRSFRSDGNPEQYGLFAEATSSEKNWLANKDGLNFFLWFESEKENVQFTLRLEEKLRSCGKIHLVKALGSSYLDKINKNIKYIHGV